MTGATLTTNEVIGFARVTGGGTFRLSSTSNFNDGYRWFIVDHSDGYYVSKAGGVENLPDLAICPRTLDAVVYSRHQSSGLYLGLWMDERYNWSIDETVHVGSYDVALDFAMNQNQRAFFSIEDERVIYL